MTSSGSSALFASIRSESADEMAAKALAAAALVALPVSALVHVGFVALFSWLEFTGLAMFNVASVAVLVLATVQARSGGTRVALRLAALETLAHAMVASVVLGLSAGFQLHIVPVLLVGILYRRRLGVLLAVLSAAALCFVLAFGAFGTPITSLSARSSVVLGLANLGMMAGNLSLIMMLLSETTRRLQAELAREHELSDALLANVLPTSVIERLKLGESTIADAVDDATILFADIVGFTLLASEMRPEALVGLLGDIYSELDRLADQHGVEKIKTVGDAYMVACGVPSPRPDHTEAVASFGLDALRLIEELSERLDVQITLRLGMHSGPVVAGVIGEKKFSYDLWGDTVNTAARMESHGVPGRLQATSSTAQRLVGEFSVSERGVIEVKGKGRMATCFVAASTPES